MLEMLSTQVTVCIKLLSRLYLNVFVLFQVAERANIFIFVTQDLFLPAQISVGEVCNIILVSKFLCFLIQSSNDDTGGIKFYCTC